MVDGVGRSSSLIIYARMFHHLRCLRVSRCVCRFSCLQGKVREGQLPSDMLMTDLVCVILSVSHSEQIAAMSMILSLFKVCKCPDRTMQSLYVGRLSIIRILGVCRVKS